MARGNKNIGKEGAKTQFKKGADPRRNTKGRPKKFVLTLAKERGYTASEVTDTFKAMIALDRKELKLIETDDNATILERIVAAALLGAKQYGNLSVLETLITRCIGSPKQVIETTPPNPVEQIDYTKLSDSALREIANATKSA